MTDSKPSTGSVWCEHCRDHFPESHYGLDGDHFVGSEYGPVGATLRLQQLEPDTMRHVFDGKLTETLRGAPTPHSVQDDFATLRAEAAWRIPHVRKDLDAAIDRIEEQYERAKEYEDQWNELASLEFIEYWHTIGFTCSAGTAIKHLLEQYENVQAELREWQTSIATEALQDELRSTKEQLEALRDAALRVMDADNMSLGAQGEEGIRAMREMEDALENLGVVVNSNPASRPESE